jgi:hypothetical protein
LVHLVAAERDEVIRAGAPILFVPKGFVHAAQLGAGAGNVEQAVLRDVGVDAFGLGDGDDLVDGPAHGAHEVDDTPVPVRRGICVAFAGQLGRQPAAIAARGAEAGELTLQHDDAQVGLRLLEVVRGPQTGEPGTDDAHVGVAVTRQRRPPVRQADRAVPERHVAVDELGGPQRDSFKWWAG